MWQSNLYAHRRRCKSENSQAKGLDSDGTLESNQIAPTKQPVYTGNLSGYSYRGIKTMTEDAVDAVIVFMPLFFYINSFFHKY